MGKSARLATNVLHLSLSSVIIIAPLMCWPHHIMMLSIHYHAVHHVVLTPSFKLVSFLHLSGLNPIRPTPSCCKAQALCNVRSQCDKTQTQQSEKTKHIVRHSKCYMWTLYQTREMSVTCEWDSSACMMRFAVRLVMPLSRLQSVDSPLGLTFTGRRTTDTVYSIATTD